MAKEKNNSFDSQQLVTGLPDTQNAKPEPVKVTFSESNRICFIVTKNKRRTWAEDLHACELKTKGDQVYH